jgi:hypothetical protein
MDAGIYVFSLVVSDPEPLSVSASFTVTIQNLSPKIVTAPAAITMAHGTS